MPNYTLDLPTILAVFLDQKRTGELRAENVRLRNRGIFQVSVTFYSGKDISYIIKDANGHFFAEGEKARQLLIQAGRIEWSWTPQALPTREQSIQPSPAMTYSDELNLVFQRSQRSTRELTLLPRSYQRLLLLVDGQRTVAQIAALFPGTTAEEIYRALIELQNRGWLTRA